MTANRFAGTCRNCGVGVAAAAGLIVKVDGAWRVECANAQQCAYRSAAPKVEPKKVDKPTATVGDLSGILALFAKARAHLKFPAVVLGVPGFADDPVRINVAGDRAKIPGSLTVVSAERNGEGERDWFGRIMLDGSFHNASALDRRPDYLLAVSKRLRAFAANPAEVGGEDGRLHGRCCFCRRALTDERSTAAGYGETCADHFGLPWGDRPAKFAEPLRRAS